MSTYASLNNKELVTAIQAGNKAVFEFLFNQHYGSLVGYITTFRFRHT